MSEQVHSRYLCPSALKDLVADLNSVAARWHDLGVQLGIDDGELKNISGEEGRAQSCFREMLMEWMKNQTPTCRAIIDALQSRVVQHNALARELERTKGFFLLWCVCVCVCARACTCVCACVSSPFLNVWMGLV